MRRVGTESKSTRARYASSVMHGPEACELLSSHRLRTVRPSSAPRPRHRVNRSAHLLMPPLRRTNAASGSAFVLYSAAYRSTRDHLDRVRLSTFSRSAVHKITAANGSSVVGKSTPCSLQRPTCPADGAILRLPPHHQIEHGAEVSIDRVAITTGLALLPSISHPGEILPAALPWNRALGPWRSVLIEPRSGKMGALHARSVRRPSPHGKSAISSSTSRSASASFAKHERDSPSTQFDPWR